MPISFFSVNMTGQGKVAMTDFELLKVLGTGGKYRRTYFKGNNKISVFDSLNFKLISYYNI